MEKHQDDPPAPSVPEIDVSDHPECDLDIPDNPILNFASSLCNSSEDLVQALQAYEACSVPCPDSTMIPERTINHHFTYHIAQAS